MKMILLGTGTSQGVPVIGCKCEVCASPHNEDKRTRCSAYVENEGNSAHDDDGSAFPTTNLLIDCGPEFRLQALRANISRLDGVLITHSHADHVHGLDDLRTFSHTISAPAKVDSAFSEGKIDKVLKERQKRRIDPKYKRETLGSGLSIYTNQNTIDDLNARFSYVFKHVSFGGGLPKFTLVPCENFSRSNPLKIGSILVIPVPMIHGPLKTVGWILQDEKSGRAMAYLTDCNFIGEASMNILASFEGAIDHVVIDGLRMESHPSHFNFLQALECAEKIGATHTWLTHFTHNLFHTEIQEYLDEKLQLFPKLKKIVENGGSVAPAYDGLELHTE